MTNFLFFFIFLSFTINFPLETKQIVHKVFIVVQHSCSLGLILLFIKNKYNTIYIAIIPTVFKYGGSPDK